METGCNKSLLSAFFKNNEWLVAIPNRNRWIRRKPQIMNGFLCPANNGDWDNPSWERRLATLYLLSRSRMWNECNKRRKWGYLDNPYPEIIQLEFLELPIEIPSEGMRNLLVWKGTLFVYNIWISGRKFLSLRETRNRIFVSRSKYSYLYRVYLWSKSLQHLLSRNETKILKFLETQKFLSDNETFK